ncbi:conserved hypothetical protein [Coccidioides posadasii str. Silveira]|uniref:Uncharacterized protein n=1 Tax=Coccidioides posadasii (strain RMSCC 757 / Silveira) TaxID=443226 RepID=E9DJD8_COCPS|nr:conserved hypothetical protein [Coccidioides posadasii str. Silveira]
MEVEKPTAEFLQKLQDRTTICSTASELSILLEKFRHLKWSGLSPNDRPLNNRQCLCKRGFPEKLQDLFCSSRQQSAVPQTIDLPLGLRRANYPWRNSNSGWGKPTPSAKAFQSRILIDAILDVKSLVRELNGKWSKDRAESRN